MKKYKRNRMSITLVILAFVLVISIGYAALTTALKINGHVLIGETTFNIHFDNVQPTTHKAEVVTEAHIVDEPKTEIAFDVSIPRLGDYYKFTTDIVNDGSIPGVIKSIEYNGLTESQKRVLNFRAYYTNSNKVLAIGDYLGPEQTKNITVELAYELSEDVTDDDLIVGDLELNCSIIIRFENGDINIYRSRAAANRLMQDVDYFPTSFLNFYNSASSDEHQGIYRLDGTENDDFPIYFYRGSKSVINNHVNFGGYCWRIIRTTSTGGIKMLYNGLPNADGQCKNNDYGTNILPEHIYGSDNNYETSSIKTWLSTWYFEHLINYQAYLEDTPFCNSTYSNGDVSLTCSEANTISVANHKNNYPIGLITAQEANLCGMSTNSSSFAWLAPNPSSADTYMTMSYLDYNHIWYVEQTKLHNYAPLSTVYGNQKWAVRPVISLNSEVVLSGGNGSENSPYTVSLG